MSNRNFSINPVAAMVIEQCNLKPILADNVYGHLQANIRQLAMSDDEKSPDYQASVYKQVCQAYGFTNTDASKPYIFSSGVAVIPIHGMLINRFGGTWGWVTGYQYIRRMAALAAEDKDVELIVYDHHSGGGMVSGAFETHDFLMSLRGKKPSVAVVDHASYSAAYMMAVAADKIFVTRTGGVGSVGVWTMHVDMSKMLEEYGLKVTLIQSGENKTDGHPFAELPESVRADIQASVDKTRQEFVTLVATARNIDEKLVYDTEGRTYDADVAVEMGLADGVATPAVAISTMLNTETEDEEMATSAAEQPQAGATAPTVDKTAERNAERQRVAGILNCEEAKGREELANHLAFDTEMSVEASVAMLAKAPKAAAAAPVADQNAGNAFDNAMATTPNPNLAQDASAAVGERSAADNILSDFKMATGQDLTAK